LLALLLLAGLAGAAWAQGKRDILWNIVSNCLARDAAAHARDCPSPRQTVPLAEKAFANVAEATRYCRGGSEVWGEVADRFVAFRDIKMCACPDNRDFIHGLAIPYTKVPGVDGPNRPDGIWAFAWQVASEKIGAASRGTIALAVNSAALRSQDQLHVHILRLREDYLRRIEAHPEHVLRTVRLKDLERVWHEVPLPADAVPRFHDFGVLVTSDGADGYILRVIRPEISPEDEYTVWQCPR